MSQVPVKYVDPDCLFQTKGLNTTVIPVVPLSALRELFKDYYIGLAALQQTPEDMLLRLSVKIRLRQATERLLASLGEVRK